MTTPAKRVDLPEGPKVFNDEIEVEPEEVEVGAEVLAEVPADPLFHDEDPTSPAEVKTVSWFRQLYFTTRKNVLLMSRRPLMLCVMLSSSIISVVLSWLLARPPKHALYGPLTECGMVDPFYFESLDNEAQDNVQITQNDRFRTGFVVAIMAVGPMINAVCAFMVVHDEFANQLFGTLRALGLRDSAYWMSWYTTLLSINCVNSILGMITAKSLPLHAFENIYAGGIFASLFFLHVALVPTSFFLAALMRHAKQGFIMVLMIVAILIAVWVGPITLVAQSELPWWANDISRLTTPNGQFWMNMDTSQYDSYYNFQGQDNENTGVCQIPLVSKSQGDFFKTDEQRADMADEDFFVGCYFGASWHTKVWNPTTPKQTGGLIAHFMFPYFHFSCMWGNFVGYTAIPDNKFESKHFSMSSEELAVDALPAPSNPDNALTSKLMPQGSMLLTSSAEYRFVPCSSFDFDCPQLQTCPLPNRTDAGFCEFLDNCNYLEQGSPTKSPSAAQSLLYLILNAIIYLMLASYWAQVFPGMNGKAQKFYFFALPSYWLGSSKSNGQSNTYSDEEGALDRNKIVVSGASKTYGQIEALKGVSMKMNRGEVAALLGHNGAGKTTLSHIISCEIAPSAGDVNVFGTSVSEDPYAVRCMVGLCKQDDYLWSTLSAREHLELFAGLRGLQDADMEDTVQKWLESVDLATVQLQYSSSFSGGMKRRLSVALATIGERPLIILDEPTTGMDPVSRRFVWRHLDAIKDGKVIILTTHAMEEADLLADEVAIMRKGDLAALGSPLELKAEHGSALQFTLLVEKEDIEATNQYLSTFFAGFGEYVSIESASAGNITVNIKKVENEGMNDGVNVELLSSFVSWLNSDDSLVNEYGFSNSSLEEVFLQVTGESSPEEVGQQGLNVAAASAAQDQDLEAEPEQLDEIASFKPTLTVTNQVKALVIFFAKRNWLGRGSISNYVVYGILTAITLLIGFSANSSDSRASFTMPTITATLMLAGISGVVYADRAQGLFLLMRTQGMLPQSFLVAITSYALIIQFVFTLILLSLLFATSMFRTPTKCEEANEYECDWPSFGETPKYTTYNGYIIDYRDDDYSDNVRVYAHRAPGGYGGILALVVCFTLTVPGAVLSSSFLPGYKLPLVFVSFMCIVASLLPLIYFFLNDFRGQEWTRDCVDDFLDYSDKPKLNGQEDGSEQFCGESFNKTTLDEYFVNCVGLQLNWIGQYCTPAYTGLLPSYGLFQGLSMIYTEKLLFTSEPEEYINEVFMSNIENAKCSGNICEFPYAKRLFNWTLVFMVIGAVCLFVLGLLVTGLLAFPSGPILKLRMHLSHLLDVLRCKGSKGITEMERLAQEENTSDDVKQESETVRGIVDSFVETIVEGEVEEGQALERLELDHGRIPRDDVAPVLAYKMSKIYPALGGRPPKKALQDLDLHVPKGQCLGFLGKNGAGKTTALKILAGAQDPSSGFGLVAGYDAAVERIEVFERLGNCPQFDVVWLGESVQTHLEFFARLKGLPAVDVKRAAHGIARAVGLGAPSVYSRSAGALSGGMRRRLSIAMSLIGSPTVVIMDEPTTGLDPSTRNTIWALINSFNSHDRSMIITTHMMIEADTLCNRIAIIGDGRLKVIGTQQHLKSAYGSGYLLQLNLVRSSAEDQRSAMQFVMTKLHPQAQLATKQAKTLHISLPRDLDLERVFRALYSPASKTEGRINQFLLSQSSLEDVFIAIGD